VTLNQCTVAGCSSGNFGGGIFNNSGVMTLNECTLSGNSAQNYGGGVYNVGTMTFNQCTVAGNSTSIVGGGVYNLRTNTFNQCTVSGNFASVSGGGIYNNGTVNVVFNSIVAANSAGSPGADIYGGATFGGTNIVQSASHGTYSGAISAAPNLAPLGNYGGPTQTMPPLGGSPAIDAGSDSATNLFATDQRGFPRFVGAHADIGAVEVQINPAAASLVVTTNNDFLTDATNNGVSLRSAVSYAAAKATLTFAPTLSGSTINLNSVLNLTGSLTIDASGLSNGITINGSKATSLFVVNPGTTVVFNSLIIANGAAGGANAGGGIYNSGTLTLNQCTVSGNSAGAGGGIANNNVLTLNQCTVSGNSALTDNGGGINNIGYLTVNECTFSGNSCDVNGGGIYNTGALTVNQCTLSGNSLTANGAGGGIDNNSGILVVSNSIVAANSAGKAGMGADIYGGATFGGSNIVQSFTNGTYSGPFVSAAPNLAPLGNYGGPTQTMPPLGGSPAIDLGSDAVTNLFATDQRGFPRLVGTHADIGAVEVQFNRAASSLVVTTTNDFVSDITNNGLSLRSATSYAAANATVAFAPALAGGTIKLSSVLTVTGNLTIDASGLSNGITINGNQAIIIFQVNAAATAVFNSLIITKGTSQSIAGGVNNTGTLTLNQCTVSGNSGGGGGGIDNGGTLTFNQCTISGNSAGGGGGIYNSGRMTLNQCTVSGNSASAAAGGGIFSYGTLTLNECTLNGNFTVTGGGGIYNDGALMLNQCTVSGNAAVDFGGGIWASIAGTVLSNSIVAANTASAGPDIYGGATAGGSNIVQASANGALTGTPTINANPNLAPLGSYGGPTQTMPPLPGSPAIDAGSATSFTTDQRGYPRVLGAAPEIGAVEGVFNPTMSLVNPVHLGNGAFQFGFSNLDGASFFIRATTNLALPLQSWTVLGSAVETSAGSGQFQFTDLQSTNYPFRFYRVNLP
jgi:predicted outer membrane repeat protein